MLSVFLSILMLLSSFVFVNPTVSKAATSITHTPRANVVRNYLQDEEWGTVYNVDYPTWGRSVKYSDGANHTNIVSTFCAIYDYNPNATNYFTSGGGSGYWWDGWDGTTFKKIHHDAYKFDPSKLSCSGTSAYSTTYLAQIASASLGAYTYGSFSIQNKVFAINTEEMIKEYDDAMAKIGNVNTEHYSTSTWDNYMSALRVIKGYIDNGVHVNSLTANPQRDIYNARYNLIKARGLLSKQQIGLGNIYKQVEGATLDGPRNVYVGTPFEVTVKLQEGYTDSVPKVQIMYGSRPVTVTGTKKSGTNDTYVFKITIDSEDVTSITPTNVKKNTYTVSVPGSATGLSIGNSGNHSVTHGNSFTFTVTKQTGYTQKTPVVRVNGTQIAGVESGNTYTYTISGITGNKNVTIDGQSVNSYSVGYELGEGASKGSGTATAINHFGSATIKITVDGAHNQVTSLPISVSNGTISGETKSGNTFTYTLSNVTANTTVKVGNLNKNKYTVTIPAGTGYSSNVDSRTVTHGDNFDFTVTLDAAHSQTPPKAFLAGKELSYTKVGENSYKFNTGAVYASGDVSISNIKINYYAIELPADTDAFKVTDVDGFNHASIKHGDSYKFTVTVDKAYTQTAPTVTLKDGTVLTADSSEFVGGDAKGNKVYTYTVENVTDFNKVTVKPIAKNTYSAVLPFDADGSYKATNEKANAENVVEGIVYGTDLTFGVALGEQYNRSKITVKYKGTVLTPDEAGNYTIKNITRNIEAGDIVVEGVKLNHYYITLPLETETGFVIEVADGLNAKSVLSGTDFGFKFFLDPAYSNSNPTIKVSRDGGKHYTVLNAENGNEYTINEVLSDCIVVVENVKKNTYTVKFVDGATVLDEHKDVLYGSDVSYEGETPTRATEKVSETTDENGNTVLVERKYKFIGWSQDTTNVTSDLTVTPIFEVSEVTTTTPAGGGQGETVITKKTATIRFISDGLTIHKETVNKGESFLGWNEVPVKTSSNPYEKYEFLGWDINGDGTPDYTAENNAIENVQDDIELVAVFKSNLPTRTVNFYNFDGSKLLYTADVKCGSRVVRELYGLDGSPARIDNKYEYTFSGWAYVKDGAKKDVIDKLVIGEGESAIDFFAAYSREKITYTYKYINDGTVMQEGSYNFVDDGQVTDVRYTGETPKRASSKSTDYTFRYWVRSNVEGSRYDYIYTADYAESTREYTYTLPTADGATVALGEGIGETVKWNEDLVFTVTLDEGHDQNAPVVKSNGKLVEAEKVSDNTYKYVIRADGADAEEIEKKLNEITVSTTVNEYLVKLTYVDENGVEKEVFNGLVKHGKSPNYVDPTKPSDPNGVYKLVGWDTNKDGKADIKGRIENVKKAITGVAVFEYDHRHDGNPDDPDGVWELYPDLTKKADCTHDGSKTYGCKHCGITKVVIIPARTHNMTEWHIDKAPTCTETGLKSRHCQNTVATDEYEACSYAENGVVIPATGHHDSDGDYKCDDCGADLGHCSSCICHKGNVLSKVIRKICTILSKTFHTKIKCCKCMKWYGDEISSIS